MKGSDIFTAKARTVIEIAMADGTTLDTPEPVTDHLLLAILTEHSSAAAMALRSAGVNIPSEHATVTGESSEKPASATPSDSLWRIAELSWKEALELGHDYVGPEHLLLAMTRDSCGMVSLHNLSGDPSEV